MKTPLLVAVLLVIAATNLRADEPEWLVDFEKARKQAVTAEKDLLVHFTGSDWCGFCIQLHEEVLGAGKFRREIPERFILVKIDFPEDRSALSEETIAQNAALAKTYRVQTYPTIILMDTERRPYARTGYRPGGVNSYLDHLGELRQVRVARDEALKLAEKQTGVEKARTLAVALEKLPEMDLDTFYRDVAGAIAESDPNDEAGFQKARAYRQALKDLYRKGGALVGAGDPETALKEIEAFLAKYDPQGIDRQEVLMGKVTVHMESRDSESALAVLEEIKKIDSHSKFGREVDQLKAEIASYLQQEGSSEEGSSE